MTTSAVPGASNVATMVGDTAVLQLDGTAAMRVQSASMLNCPSDRCVYALVKQVAPEPLRIQGRQAPAILLVWAGVALVLSALYQYYLDNWGELSRAQVDHIEVLQSSSTVAFSTKSGDPPGTFTMSDGKLVAPSLTSSSAVNLPTQMSFKVQGDYFEIAIPKVLYSVLTDKNLFPSDCWNPHPSIQTCARQWMVNIWNNEILGGNGYLVQISTHFYMSYYEMWVWDIVFRRFPLIPVGLLENIPPWFIGLERPTIYLMAAIVHSITFYMLKKTMGFATDVIAFYADWLSYGRLLVPMAELARDVPELRSMLPSPPPPLPWDFQALTKGNCPSCVPEDHDGKFDVTFESLPGSTTSEPNLQYKIYLRDAKVEMKTYNSNKAWNAIPVSPGIMWSVFCHPIDISCATKNMTAHRISRR